MVALSGSWGFYLADVRLYLITAASIPELRSNSRFMDVSYKHKATLAGLWEWKFSGW
jgi:hypothetical protein